MSATTHKVSIVLVGEFNPDDFLPNNLLEGKVIAKKTAESVTITAMMPSQTVQFKLNWAELLVVPNRLQVTSLEAPHIRICDLVLKALQELAPKSNVSQFGINVDLTHDFGTFEKRNDFGRKISPPEVWGSWGQMLLASMTGEECGTSMQGGLMGLHMRKPFMEKDGVTGWRDVIVVPSADIKTGVSIRSNHHHQLTNIDPDAEKSEQLSEDKVTSLLLTALSNGFEKSIADSISIFEEVLA